MTDANGTVFTHVHDALGRLVQRTAWVPPGSSVSLQGSSVTRGYDGAGGLRHANNGVARLDHHRDSFGSVRRETVTFTGEDPLDLVRSFDLAGRVLETTYPGGTHLVRARDGLGRIESIDETGAGTLASYLYFGPDRLEQRTTGDGSVMTRSFDVTGRVASVVTTSPRPDPEPDATLVDLHFQWDPWGNREQRTNALEGLELVSAHDHLRRLVTSTRAWGQQASSVTSYALDPVGNRLSVSVDGVASQYVLEPERPDGTGPKDLEVNQYTQVPGGGRTYDENGNLLSETNGQSAVLELTYDVDDRLVRVDDLQTGLIVQHGYDPLGRRVRTATTTASGWGLVEWAVHDGDEIVELRSPRADATLGVDVVTIYGRALDELVVERRAGGEEHWFHQDDQMSVMAVTDGAGELLERYWYEDYGVRRVIAPDGVELAASAIDNRHGFTGRPLDEATGWYYFRARYMDPEHGRFVTRDPLGTWGDPGNVGSGVAYAGNNPGAFVDPTGLQQRVIDRAADEDLLANDAMFARILGSASSVEEEDPGIRAVNRKDALQASQKEADGQPGVLEDAARSTANDIKGRVTGIDDTIGDGAEAVLGPFVDAATDVDVRADVPRDVDLEAGINEGLGTARKEANLERESAVGRSFVRERGKEVVYASASALLALSKVQKAARGAAKFHKHHTVPREILKSLPEDVANNPLVRGRRGAPNRWSIPEDLHKDIHRGAGGGAYNEAWKQRLGDLGREPTVDDVLRIRDELVDVFGLGDYRP